MRSKEPIEHYVLYGEPIRDVELHFLHVEPIRVRSGRFDWTIEAHSHAELHQLLLVKAGDGKMRIEEFELAIEPPALLIIPAGTVHAFDFAPDTDGWVISVAENMILEAAGHDSAVISLFSQPRRIHVVGEKPTTIFSEGFESLANELVWTAPAQGLAIRAEFLRILVRAARLVAYEVEAEIPLGSADAALTERFKKLINADFRRAEPIVAYARRLGVSEDRLQAACRRRLGQRPLGVLQRRVVLEAQRWLVHTTLPIGAIGHELGFRDPAYFSRFFKRNTGETPKVYRARVGRVVPEPRAREGA